MKSTFADAVSRYADNCSFFADALRTGSHAQSLGTVIADKADTVAIDPASPALESEEIRSAIKVIGWTDAARGLRLFTALATSHDDVNILPWNISYVFLDAVLAPARSYLRLTDFEVLPEAACDAVLAMEQRALDRSYPRLA